MIKLFQYQIIHFLRKDLEIIQVLEWSKKPYRLLVGKVQCIQIPFIDPLLNQQKYPYKKFLEILLDLDIDINMDFKENSRIKKV